MLTRNRKRMALAGEEVMVMQKKRRKKEDEAAACEGVCVFCEKFSFRFPGFPVQTEYRHWHSYHLLKVTVTLSRVAELPLFRVASAPEVPRSRSRLRLRPNWVGSSSMPNKGGSGPYIKFCN